MNRWFAPTLNVIIRAGLVAVVAAAIQGETAICFGINSAQWICILGLKYREAFQ